MEKQHQSPSSQAEQSRALQYADLAEEKASQLAELSGVEPKPISQIGIIGGGLMGCGIAVASLLAGYQVTLLEMSDEKARQATERIGDILLQSVKRGKLSEESYPDTLSRLLVSSDYEDFKECDLAIEAVFEDLEVKIEVARMLASIMARDAIIVTNTSYLNPNDIFKGLPEQKRFLGLHFFSPAHIMKLVEIIPLTSTSAEILATAFAFTSSLGKVAVPSGICDGFIENRMLARYRRTADQLLVEGALPQDIDTAMRTYGLPIGPYELQDRTGLDIAWGNRKRSRTHLSDKDYVPIADTLCEAGRFGIKTGAGWYDYDQDGAKSSSEFVASVILDYSFSIGVKRQPLSKVEIQKRIMLALTEEGHTLLKEGIARQASDIDVVQLLGYGFPRWRGGPMYELTRQS